MSRTREQTFYLILSPGRYSGLRARIATKAVSLGSNERAMRLNIRVPDALFNIPTITAQVSIPDSAVSAPEIDASVLDNVRELLEQKTGLDVNVTLVEQA